MSLSNAPVSFYDIPELQAQPLAMNQLSVAVKRSIGIPVHPDPNDTPDDTKIDLILAAECAEFYHNPLGWVYWAFDWGYGDLADMTGPDQWQIDFLTDMGNNITENWFDGVNPVMPIREATASGHGIGKSALVAWIILFIMSTRPYAKGIVTANTGDQLRTKTWGELSKWKTKCITGHWFELNSGKGSLSMYHKGFPEQWRVDAMTCREENSEAFAGLHAATSTPFYIFDEASAVPDKIWEVAEGGLTDGEPMFIAFGNPTRNIGKFRTLFDSGSGWHTRSVDSRTARMTNKKLIASWIETHGDNSDFVRVRVKGEFPKADDTQFMPSDVVNEARKRGPGRYLGTDPLICGIDVSRGGSDPSVIQFRRGKDAKSEKVYKIPGEKTRDSMKLVALIITVLDRHKPDVTFLDVTGIGGPIVDRLVQLGYHVIGVGFGHKADDEKLYSNKTAEMGARCKAWLFADGAIPDSPELERELTTRAYWHDKIDRLVLDPKDLVKEEIGHSPDWADALYLTFAHAVPPLQVPRGMRDVSYEARAAVSSRSRDYNPLDAMDN